MKGIEYVLVPDDEGVAEDAPAYPESREYINRWSDPTCLHIGEDLLKLFKGGNPRAFLDKSFFWTRKQGIELPEELLVERFSWLLYINHEPEQDTESISPVHPGEIGRLEESALKEYVQKMVDVLGRFPITRVELHLFDRPKASNLFYVNPNAKYALLFVPRSKADGRDAHRA
jgi:hypothetical protein